MKINVEKPSDCQRVLTIEVPFEQMNTEIENIFSNLAKEATHPGFRKGKVPKGILKKKFDKSVQAEAMEKTISTSLQKALQDEKLVPISEPDLGEVKFEDESPLSFTATIEVAPTVELPEYKGIELKRPKWEVKDDDIDKVLQRLQVSQAKYFPAERAVEKGDFIVLDFQAFENGEPMKDAKAENFPLEVGSGAFGEDFENQVVGMNKDEKKEITVKYPDDYAAKDLAGKEVVFETLVKDLKIRQLPELDDDFAKDLGEHDTLDALKDHIRERLEDDMKRRMEHFLREQAITKIVSESELEVPPKLKAKAAESIYNEEMEKAAQQGASRDDLVGQRDKLIEYANSEAERQMKLSFVTEEIGKRENLDITNEELDEKLEEMAKEIEEQNPNVREHLKSDRMRRQYRDQIQVKKILDFLVDGAKIVDIEEDELEAEDTATSDKDKTEGDT